MKAASAVHFIGIGGIGMSALARILLQQGVPVSGSSDRANAQTEALAREGATIGIGHEARYVDGAARVIVSSAIGDGNPELRAAHARGIPVLKRGSLLAELMARNRGISIAGTHGKSTTTAMTASVVEAGGFDPTIALGGLRADTKTNARYGRGEWFVAESDESDRSFLELSPEIAVVTNIENDHINSDDEIAELERSFEAFLCNLPHRGLALVGIDEPRAARLARAARRSRTRTFGFGDADIRALAPAFVGFGSVTRISVDGALAGELRLAVPGRINVANALAAVGIGLELGMPFGQIADALAAFGGVARRFELLARTARMSLVDDYAHHPTAVAATLAAARAAFDGPVIAVFQPHRYTRTRYLANDFARALAGADRVVVTDIYSASEDPIAGVSAASILEPLRAGGTAADHVPNVADAPAHVLRTAPPGALVLFLGAGSISQAAHDLARELESAPVP